MSWRDLLPERQRKEVELAETYAGRFNHGTPGHNRLVLVAKLAGMLDAGQALPPPRRWVLAVPYHSQHEDDALRFRKDCGPDCVEMVGEYYDPATDATTDDIMAWITGGVDRATFVSELTDAASHFYGLELTRHEQVTWEQLRHWVVAERRPVIVLVHYGSFRTRMDRKYTGGHFMVVVGFDQVDYQGVTVERAIVHDPDFYAGLQGQGAFIPIVEDHFMGMWDDCHLDNNPRRLALVTGTVS